jgi:DNA-directed RNA polymerase specialized sigma24 family protein
VLELRLAGLTGSEISQTLGVSESAVKSIQFRAYTTLRDALRQANIHSSESLQ